MRPVWLIAALLCALSSAAWAQGFGNLGPGPSSGGCPLSGCTFSGAVNTTDPGGFQINGVSQLVPVPGGAGLTTTISTDFATSGGNTRNNMHQTTLSPSVNTPNVWENDNSFLILNGPGQANGELNIQHSYFQVNAGAFATQVETNEASMLNNGTIGTFDGYLSTLNNGAAGTATRLNGINLALNQSNAAAGAVGTYAGISCSVMAGGGSVPTLNYCLSNSDPAQSIITLGNIGIGSVTPPPAATLMQIIGPDALSTTFPLVIKAAGGKQPMTVNDAGTTTVLSNIIIGLSGSSPAGTLSFLNATSGSIKLAPPTGALGAGTVFLPVVAATDTLAVLGLSQTHTATQTFSGTLNASGVLQGNGVAGVTCATGAPTASFSSSNGIVTHC